MTVVIIMPLAANPFGMHNVLNMFSVLYEQLYRTDTDQRLRDGMILYSLSKMSIPHDILLIFIKKQDSKLKFHFFFK